jgi:hypothetical protein
LAPPTPLLRSSLCTQRALESPAFDAWVRALDPWAVKPDGSLLMHRKVWERAFIAQALAERGLLAPGKSGLGFAVGQEPLPSLFAGRGCDVLATDLAAGSAAATAWADTGQHAAGPHALYRPDLCDRAAFDARVRFAPLDMNHVPDRLGPFDFCWSSCALEHLGSLDLGVRFVERSLGCLAADGVAVHTTEFNVSSNSYTVAEGSEVLYRRCDIEALAARLTAAGHRVELDFDAGAGPADCQIDPPPYREEPHLKLLLHGYVSTSIGLIVEKGRAGRRPPARRLLRSLARRVRRLSPFG